MLLLNIQHFTDVLKLFAIYNNTEKNKNKAKNDSIISFSKDQIEFCSMALPDSTLYFEITYEKKNTRS